MQVAVHELGHVLGLNHSDAENSVMNAIYHQSIRGEFELSDNDRQEVKRAYGELALPLLHTVTPAPILSWPELAIFMYGLIHMN